MRKPIAIALAMTMTVSAVLTGCGGSSSSNSSSSSDSGSGADSEGIELINGKPEIDESLQKLAAKYEEETGNKITITTIGGDRSAADELKSRYQANDMPDIFFTEIKDFATWTENADAGLADMSDWDWVKKSSYGYVDGDNGTIGFPYTLEACGLAYNADLLEKAGVDPAKLTNLKAYEDAFKTLDSKKEELGLTAVVGYCANATTAAWSAGTHIFGQYLDAGLKPDDTTYIDMLNDGGKLDEKRFKAFGEFISLLNQYGDPATMVSGTVDDQVKGFAGGKYAFMTQGSWEGNVIATQNKEDYDAAGNFKCGFAPYAFEDGIDTILNGAPNYWSVYAKGNVDASKEFLEWVAGDSGQQIMVEEAGLVSPFDDCKYVSADPFGQAVMDWAADGKYSSYHTMSKKAGLENETGVIFQNFAKGDIKDVDEFYTKMQEVCTNYYKEK